MDRTYEFERNEKLDATEQPETGHKPVLELDVEVLEDRIAPANVCCTLY